jgi:hypothetical protein
MRSLPKKQREAKEEEGEKGMSVFGSDCIAGQLDFDELRRWAHTPRNGLEQDLWRFR